MEFYKEFTHYNKEIEKAVIGGFLLDRFALKIMRHIVDVEMFYDEMLKTIFICMLKMTDEDIPIDILTVQDYLCRRSGSLIKKVNPHATVRDISWLIVECTREVVSPIHLEYHIFILRQLWAERAFVDIQNQAINEQHDVLERAERVIENLQKIKQIRVDEDFQDMSITIDKLRKHMLDVFDKEYIGTKIGIERYDKITSGLDVGLHIWAARPSVGKTALLGTAAVNQAKENIPVGIISLEMNDVQLTARMAANVANMEFYKIYRNFLNDDEFDYIEGKLTNMTKLPIFISDKCNVNIHEIRAKAYKLKKKHDVKILYVDYLQLIEGDTNKSREQVVSGISRGLKILSKELQIPIVALAQLSREAAKNGNEKPKLSHLRESGSIEQDADSVLFIHSPFHNGEAVDETGCSWEGKRILIIAKHRNGELDEFPVIYEGAKMRFLNDPSADFIQKNRPAPISEEPPKNTFFNTLPRNNQEFNQAEFNGF